MVDEAIKVRFEDCSKMNRQNSDERQILQGKLLSNIKQNLNILEKLLDKAGGEWYYEDQVYRFYHQSFKVYGLQDTTKEIVEALEKLLPEVPINPWFKKIIEDGTGKIFSRDDNSNWLSITRPILEAFFHAKYFLEMVCKYGKELEAPPDLLPSGWAAVLYFYNLR